MNIVKGHVKGHTRKTKSGKVSVVRDFDRSGVEGAKKTIEKKRGQKDWEVAITEHIERNKQKALRLLHEHMEQEMQSGLLDQPRAPLRKWG